MITKFDKRLWNLGFSWRVFLFSCGMPHPWLVYLPFECLVDLFSLWNASSVIMIKTSILTLRGSMEEAHIARLSRWLHLQPIFLCGCIFLVDNIYTWHISSKYISLQLNSNSCKHDGFVHISSHRTHFTPISVWSADLVNTNKKKFRQQNSLFRQFHRFFAKWGLLFAKWGLLFARLYVCKSPAVLLNLGHPIVPLHFVSAI